MEKDTYNDVSYNEIENHLTEVTIRNTQVEEIETMMSLELTKAEEVEKRDRHLKVLLMGSIHYGVNVKKVVEIFAWHTLLLPTLLQMIRERPHYRRVMARVLLTFDYLESTDGRELYLYHYITENISEYRELISRGVNGSQFLVVLDMVFANRFSAKQAFQFYLRTLEVSDDKDGVELVKRVALKEF